MIHLSKRLQACADLVRSGARMADIGCDHGYVPVYLVQTGKCPSAVAADINEGPLASCRRLVMEYNLEDKIACVLSDGTAQIDGDQCDDVLLAGMGGELIAAILSKCDFAREKHLVLNPMTHPEQARKWLFDNGFTIQKDVIIPDGRHHYNVLDAVYTGEKMAYSYADLWLGNITDFSDTAYFEHLLKYLKNKEKGGTEVAAVIQCIEEKLR